MIPVWVQAAQTHPAQRFGFAKNKQTKKKNKKTIIITFFFLFVLKSQLLPLIKMLQMTFEVMNTFFSHSKQHHKNMTWHLSKKNKLCVCWAPETFSHSTESILCGVSKLLEKDSSAVTSKQTLLICHARCFIWQRKYSTWLWLLYLFFIQWIFYLVSFLCSTDLWSIPDTYLLLMYFQNDFGYRSSFRAEVGQLLTRRPKWFLKCWPGADGRRFWDSLEPWCLYIFIVKHIPIEHAAIRSWIIKSETAAYPSSN